MTPQEKAKDLVLKYLKIDNNTKEWFNTHIAKQCALIAVDEMLNDDWYIATAEDSIERNKYWNEVKQELEKL